MVEVARLHGVCLKYGRQNACTPRRLNIALGMGNAQYRMPNDVGSEKKQPTRWCTCFLQMYIASRHLKLIQTRTKIVEIP